MLEPISEESALEPADPRWSTSSGLPIVAKRRSVAGPYDVTDPDVPVGDGALEFGSLRVPMPARAQLQVEKGSSELLRAVHVLVPSGRVSLSALAAPKSTPLWRELADEIAGSLKGDGARVRSEWGEWGREVQAGSNGALSRFIGVDGPRWMLYGVATGPADGAAELAHTLREMIRGTVVTRGTDPLPVKTVLPLRLPEHLEELVEEAREHTSLAPDDGELADSQFADREFAEDELTDDEWGSRAEPDWQGEHPPVSDPAHGAPEVDWGGPLSGRQPRAAEPVRSFDQGTVERSIGFRRKELRPVPRRAASAPGQPAHRTAAAQAGLPPVPSLDSMATDGLPRVAMDATWSMAIPVVSSDEVEDQPAWAELSAAPSFWPEPRHPGDPLGGYRLGPPDDRFDAPTGYLQPVSGEPLHPAAGFDPAAGFGVPPNGTGPDDHLGESPERRMLDDLGFGLPPTGLDPLPGDPPPFEPGPFRTGQREPGSWEPDQREPGQREPAFRYESAPSSGRQPDSPRFDSPQFDTPQFDTPRSGTASFDEPRFEEPRFGGAQFGARGFGAGEFGAGEFGTSDFGPTQVGPSRFAAPRFVSPEFGSFPPAEQPDESWAAGPYSSPADRGLPHAEEPGPARSAPGDPVRDSLHDALTSDAAVTQDRLPKVERRARHRRPD